jgi:hypothetical protein
VALETIGDNNVVHAQALTLAAWSKRGRIIAYLVFSGER